MAIKIDLSIKVTERKSVTFKNGEKVTLIVSDTKEKFQWRLAVDDVSTNWTTHYEGILTLRSPKTNALYAVAMAYWKGGLPIEKPFMIVDDIKNKVKR